MSVNKLYKFRRIDDVQYFLNGAIFGGAVNRGLGNQTNGLSGLVGTTLIFTSPSAVTVTFIESNNPGPTPPAGSAYPPGTNADPYSLLFKDIKGQIQAAIPGVLVLLDAEQNLLLVEATPSAGVAVTAAGTANTILGFDTKNASVGRLYKPSIVSNSPPCWTWAYSGNDNMHNIYTWED